MTERRLLIIGTGGHGRAVAEAVSLRGDCTVTAFLDDAAQPNQRVRDWPVWGTTAQLPACRGAVDAVMVAIGNNALREALHQRVRAEGLLLATVIHPAAWVSPSAVVGEGCAILAGAIVNTSARLGEGVIVNCGAVIDHDCTVEPFGHLGVRAAMSGGSLLGSRAWMPAGASLAPGARVAADRVLALNEVVRG